MEYLRYFSSKRIYITLTVRFIFVEIQSFSLKMSTLNSTEILSKRNILSLLAVLRKLIFSVIRQRCCHQNRTLNQTAFLPGYVKYRDQCEACMFEQGTSKLSTRNKSEKVKKSFKPGELYVKSIHLYSLQMTTWFQWHSNITTSCLIYKKCYGPHLTKKGIFYLHIKIITIIQFYMKPTPYVYKNKAMVYIWYIMQIKIISINNII